MHSHDSVKFATALWHLYGKSEYIEKKSGAMDEFKKKGNNNINLVWPRVLNRTTRTKTAQPPLVEGISPEFLCETR